MMAWQVLLAVMASAVAISSGSQITSAPEITAAPITWINQVSLYDEADPCVRAAIDPVVRTENEGCGYPTSTDCFCKTSYIEMLATISSFASEKCGGNAEDIAVATSCFVSYCDGAVGPRTAVAVTCKYLCHHFSSMQS
jgi:hypothetical protein